MLKSIRRLLVVAALASLALAPSAAVVRAADAVPPAEEGPKTVVMYVTCATGLAAAPTIGLAVAAFMVCARMFVDALSPQPTP